MRSERVGVGVDVERIARFERFVHDRRHRFLQHAFLESELERVFARPSPAQHLAARWAGKEAVIKALSGVGLRGVHWRQIEIREGEEGLPQVCWCGPRASTADIQLSLSHAAGVAVALALVQRLT